MKREIQIGRSIYLADDASRTYVFLRKIPFWKSAETNEEENMRSIVGYARIFSDGNKKVFLRSERF